MCRQTERFGARSSILRLDWNISNTNRSGYSSPFEEPIWLNMKTFRTPFMTASEAELWKVSMKLFICLPRLIALVRSLRESVPDGSISKEARALATDLMRIKAATAEDDFLHGVKIRAASHPADGHVVPYSFQYKTLAQMIGVTLYWQTQLVCNLLCANVHALGPLPKGVDFDIAEMQEQKKQMTTSLLMSWEYAHCVGPIGNWALRLGLIAVWASVRDNPAICKSVVPKKIRQWLVQRYTDLFREHLLFNEQNMDEAADLILGGPLKGFLIELYGQVPRSIEQSAS